MTRYRSVLLSGIVMIGSTILAGCGGPLTRTQSFHGAQRIVVTDAKSFGKETLQEARPPSEIADPSRLAAFEDFLERHQDDWKRVRDDPRTSRFQLELQADGRTLTTFWFEAGYLQRHDGGKRISAIRLSTEETAELASALGLPPHLMM
ncbi:hypothetical protein [Stratiformator vulcanicus]|uniref:Lipoprotein n=1 Tax=Stratiformator vulcanicus TaxID=2527980 RepID=A0A517QXR8_9PLAN|nr:hypothetical protein [Stratiformator vulcanicus]QDT36388.1 hypothetical protein Pan189_07440 [Stratiformator vulcanicus]